eukprot:scaffold3855_cov199-Alexandrium_tamarense.AAC.42
MDGRAPNKHAILTKTEKKQNLRDDAGALMSKSSLRLSRSPRDMMKTHVFAVLPHDDLSKPFLDNIHPFKQGVILLLMIRHSTIFPILPGLANSRCDFLP